MRVVIFGATGMIGQGVLKTSLAEPSVEQVLTVGRAPVGLTHPKLREVVTKDLFDLSAYDAELTGYDLCAYCLGVSSSGMSEADYTRLTYELTVSVGTRLKRLNPQMTFCFVSGASTDSTEKGPTMWARVKGKAENAILAMGFEGAYMFRPGYIQPMDGVKSRTRLYRLIYVFAAPLYPLWKILLGDKLTTTTNIGRAMLHSVTRGYPKPLLDPADINRLAEG